MEELRANETEMMAPQAASLLKGDDESGGSNRLRLWEIEYFFKCPVIGICLTLSEQRQVLKRSGISSKHRSAFEIHEILVSGAEKKGRLSEKMDDLLNRKFGPEIAPLLDLNETAILERWEACFHMGEYAGVFWAVAARPGLSIKSRRQIFGTIHMAMHGNVEQGAKLRRRLAFQEEQTRTMTLKAGEAASARKAMQKEHIRIQQAQTALSDQLKALEKENETLKRGLSFLKERPVVSELQQANALIREELSGLSTRMAEKDVHIARLIEENSRLSSEIDRQRGLSNRFQKEANELVKGMFARNRCDASCPSFDLCKRRVLIVGGLTKMEALYRQMIEDGGGIFEYHDGYMKNGLRNLESRLRRADIVLCPTSCNSHAACSLVKSLGKKHNKPVCILASSSLSAMAQALSGNAGVYASGN
jgi:hypothetical protein